MTTAANTASTAVMPSESATPLEASTAYDEISFIELPPQEDWFMETKGPQGQCLTYLEFKATGLLPRRIGPFPSRDAAILALDQILDQVEEGLNNAGNTAADQGIHVPFMRRPVVQIIDHALVQSQKGA